jgi:hypothetical protein
MPRWHSKGDTGSAPSAGGTIAWLQVELGLDETSVDSLQTAVWTRK